tara:strand:+ start:89232 stop:89426 length:195 start_codon:yes stop_codon:yes gene_type:complete
MSSYSLNGTLKDSDGNDVNVGEFAFKREYITGAIEFYTTQGFKGELTLTIEYDDGRKHTHQIKC